MIQLGTHDVMRHASARIGQYRPLRYFEPMPGSAFGELMPLKACNISARYFLKYDIMPRSEITMHILRCLDLLDLAGLEASLCSAFAKLSTDRSAYPAIVFRRDRNYTAQCVFESNWLLNPGKSRVWTTD